MMLPFQIRPAQAGDVPAVFGMIRELADFEQLSHLVVATEDSLRDALCGARPSCECLVAEIDGAPVSFALFFHNFSTFLGRKGLYLEDLYVKPAHRGKGIATAMLRRLAQLAVERQCGRFEWSVLDWNVNAIRFYEGMGATVLPDWRICRVTGDSLRDMAGAPPAA
ncbi:GNAT family N-acetyltransferase [Noviherbaspirillum galbum]|uniref:GNAT family N-acetyltransferase n=1 Tax=Noviherbaspirillum galbum TaxID=2709383 RepID=A0A6B3SRM5_9BURK|nr:GNAT family N-acetyltransferase [Noviherbaspirillum galbum]NEX63178.1 GNAT family N-acetyltransferase [Noviherbaspirillum galbum]